MGTPAPPSSDVPAPPRSAGPASLVGRLGATGISIPVKGAPDPRIDPPADLPVERRAVAGLPLDEIDAFADLPHETQATLASMARVETLREDEEVSGFGAVVILGGEGLICATIVDVPAERAERAALIPSKGSLVDGVSLRVVAGAGGVRVAVWEQGMVDAALRSCPWVLDELRATADRLQALAGVTMGPLGDLDETTRNLSVGRLQVRVVAPHEQIAEQGGPNPGLAILGAGTIEVRDASGESDVIHPGEPIFPGEMLRHEPSPKSAQAGEGGALLLVADRHLAQELLVSVPPLVEIFSA